MNQIQKIELISFATAAFCSVVAPGLVAATGIVGVISVIVAGIGAAAVASKAYLSSSPKDGQKS